MNHREIISLLSINGRNMFDHEKLIVYQRAIQFIELVGNILDNIKPKIAACEHLDEASSSIAFNIAEGNGKFSSRDRCKYFDIARGSALECSSALDVLVARNKLKAEDILQGKNMLIEIVSMLVGLIKSNSDRVYDSQEEYKI